MVKRLMSKHLLPHRMTLLAGLLALPAMALGSPSGVMGPKNAPSPADQAAPPASFISNGKTVELEAFKGHPVMLWQVATWCGSCRAGLRTFAHEKALIDKSDIRVIVLRDYKNGGYPGIGIKKFAEQTAPSLMRDAHFVFGDDTKALYALYNPHHYVDVYDLIGTDNKIQAVSSTPSATFGKIKAFIASEPKS
ncbi:redoxin family protein [Acidocella aminolytica]|uniref:Oxidoreductase n=1 Tax=Acidocella aminolytica 101 = DSM 11237 TaxID=1120923 RepID=A0A0D6PA02_9PROT|nr:redoxin family protein [Acidocella aminolytica]GAN78595.1 oxidoreductase [Acidocella aminolytica 101 = DSM 11237]SHF24193.1 Redoxin [Acidocella aminolytica 101 = DSM 11237]